VQGAKEKMRKIGTTTVFGSDLLNQLKPHCVFASHVVRRAYSILQSKKTIEKQRGYNFYAKERRKRGTKTETEQQSE
jgi:DNA-binding transcriptional regulator YhcF (GntR family)